MKIRLKAYNVFGGSRGVVPDWSEIEYTDCLNDLPVLKIKAGVGTIAAERLAAPVEVALEYDTGDGWVEPANARFISTSYEKNLADAGEYVTVPCLGVGLVTRWVSVWDQTPGNEDGKRVFPASSPGKILHTLLHAAAGRTDSTGLKWADGKVAWDFTATADTAGSAWGKNASPTFNPSDSLFKVLDWLASKGAVDWRFQGRTLQVYRDGGAMARNKPSTILRGAFSTALPVKIDLENLATIARFRGEGGFEKTKTATDAYTVFGRIERWSEQGQVNRDATADLYLDRVLTQGHRPAEQWRREWTAAMGSHVPKLWSHYLVGDWVSNGEKQLRIVEAGIKINSDGELSGWETLGTRIDSIIERLARRTTDLSSGAVGSDSGRPLPAGSDTRTPKSPSGLVTASDVVVTEQGEYRGVVTASWQKVTQATNNTAMSPARYEVGARREGEDALRVVADTTNLSAGFYGTPGTSIEVRVRAVSSTGRVSLWSAPVVEAVKKDTTPPPRPSHPIVTASLEVIEIATDGKDHAGNNMPPDLSHYEVSVKTSKANPVADSQVAAQDSRRWMRSASPGTWWVAIRAVDRAGNKSPWTVPVSVKVIALVDEEAMKFVMAKAKADLQVEADKLAEYKRITDGRLTPLEKKAQDAANSAMDAHNAAVNAQSTADSAVSAAADANQAALVAAGIADGKGKVLYSETAPTGNDRATSNLWIKPSNGKTYRWSGSAWVEVKNAELTKAAQDAVAAQNAANKAQAAADAADKKAQAAQQAATKAAASATVAEQKALTAQNAADKAQSAADAAQAQADGALERAMAAGNLIPNQPPQRWTKGQGSYEGVAQFWSTGRVLIDMSGETSLSASRIVSPRFPVQAGRTYRVYYTAAHTGNVFCGLYLYDADLSYLTPMTSPWQTIAAKSRLHTDFTIDTADTAYATVHHYVEPGDKLTLWDWEVYDITEALEAIRKAEAAQAAADEAKKAAAAAHARANQAFATASGKNKVTRSAASPGPDGERAGDIWWQVTGLGTAAEQVIGQWVWDGSKWQSSTIADEVIAYITADKIRAAHGAFDNAFIKSLMADTGFVSEFYANKFVVGGSNLVRDPAFTRPIAWPALELNEDGTASHWGSTTAKKTAYEYPYYAINLRGGQTYKLRAEVRAHGKWVPAGKLRLRLTSANRELVQIAWAFVFTDQAVGNAWVTVEGEITVPDEAVTGHFGFFIDTLDENVKISWRNPSCTAMSDGNLIVDGSITTAKLAALSVEAGNIAANAITASKIRSGAIETRMLSAGVVTGDKISATALDGKTITGALIQTRAENNRGLKLTNNQLTGYCPAGSEVFRLNESTTMWTAAGEPRQRITIDPDVGGRLRMIFQGPGDTASTYNSASIFMVDSGTTEGWEKGTLVINGSPNSDGDFAFLRIGPGKQFYFGNTVATSVPGKPQTFIKGETWRLNLYSTGRTVAGEWLSIMDAPLITSTANTALVIDSGLLTVKRTSSARRFKVNIETVEADPARLLDVPVRHWFDKYESETYANYLEDRAPDGVNSGRWDGYSQPPKRIPGLVAEEVEAAGLGEYVTYNSDGQVEGLMYDRLWTLLIPLVKSLTERVTALETRLEETNDTNTNPNAGAGTA